MVEILVIYYLSDTAENCNTLKARDSVQNKRDRTAGIQVFVFPCNTCFSFIELYKAESLSQLWFKICKLAEKFEGNDFFFHFI